MVSASSAAPQSPSSAGTEQRKSGPSSSPFAEEAQKFGHIVARERTRPQGNTILGFDFVRAYDDEEDADYNADSESSEDGDGSGCDDVDDSDDDECMFCGHSASTEQADQPDAPKKDPGWDIAIGSALKGTGKGRAVKGLKLLDAHEADGHPGVQPLNIDGGGDGTEPGGDSDSEDENHERESENSDHSSEAGPAAAGAASQKTKKRPGKKPSPFDKKVDILNKSAYRDVAQLRRALYVLGAGDPDRTALAYAKFCNKPKLRKARMVGRYGNVGTVCMDTLLHFFDNEATVTKGTRLLVLQRVILDDHAVQRERAPGDKTDSRSTESEEGSYPQYAARTKEV